VSQGQQYDCKHDKKPAHLLRDGGRGEEVEIKQSVKLGMA